MATYTVKAPDGKTITLQGPDGASQEEIIAQAQALYKPRASAAPAARKPAPPKPKSISREQRRVGVGADPAIVRRAYENARQSIVRQITDPAKRKAALLAFDSDPRAQAMRKNAGLAPLSTRQGEVRAVAKRTRQDRLKEAGRRAANQQGIAPDWATALKAGITRSLFGVPERLAAAGLKYLPSSVTGNNTDLSYDELLEVVRAKTDAELGKSTAGNIAGQVLGSVGSGGPIAGIVRAGGRRIAAAGAPRVGNVLQGLTTFRKGQKLANTGKVVTIGAAGGGAQAAGEGRDAVEGAVTGAIAAPAVVGGVKVAQVLTRPFRDVMQLSSAGRLLSRLTTSTREQLERRAAQYRQDTGAEPTLFELLPLADRNKILKTAVVGKDNVVEATSEAIRARAANLGPEMSNRAQEILNPQRQFVERSLVRDIADARGGTLDPDDLELVRRASTNPTDMLEFRDREARAIMAPFDDMRVVDNLEDLLPHAPAGGGARLSIDPEAAAVIRSAAGVLRQRATGVGVTAGDITDMISTLRGDLGKGGIEGRTAERAINHLQDVLDNRAPEAGAAARRMSDAWARRSRMAEGMKEGDATRLREEVQVGTSRRRAREVRNAYDTPEGAAGRTLGQSNRILTDLGGSPEEALRATVKMSRNNVGRQLTQNVGGEEAQALRAAARAQDESAQALAAASNKAQGGSGEGADAETLVQAIAGLHPATFITTKANAVRRLFDMTYIPENRARTIVDMVFSQDPAMVNRALRAIGNEPNGARFIKYLAGVVGKTAATPSDVDLGGIAPEAATPSVEDDLASLEEGEEAEELLPEDEMVPEEESPYAQDLQNLYDSEDPDLLDLIGRVKAQESGGRQFGEDGQPLTSSAGAIGVMQVMPNTAPEAAKLAGLPWDPQAYQNDAVYNELLGIAYLSEMLRRYDGDVDRALAAYNAGPGRVNAALSENGDDWLANLPEETQDYVARVG